MPGSAKEVLPYIVLMFLLIFKLKFKKKKSFAKNLIPTLKKSKFLFQGDPENFKVDIYHL